MHFINKKYISLLSFEIPKQMKKKKKNKKKKER